MIDVNITEMFCFHFQAAQLFSCFSLFLCRLPDNDRWLVLWVCVRGGGRQAVPPRRCPGSDAKGARRTSRLGPNGIPGIARETQVLAPPSGQFDSALFLSCFYLSNISPTPSSKTACTSRKIIKILFSFFNRLLLSFVSFCRTAAGFFCYTNATQGSNSWLYLQSQLWTWIKCWQILCKAVKSCLCF